MKHATRDEVHGFVKANIADECANIYTDEAKCYVGIGDENTNHETVRHGAGEYVRADVHTNSIEGVFSLFKRFIVGSFHQISAISDRTRCWRRLRTRKHHFSGQMPPQLLASDAGARLVEEWLYRINDGMAASSGSAWAGVAARLECVERSA